ncbi:CD164 sialomucin-like 2 protein [Silurus meridionalis]|nr:CD164 sialomucin-like 2 protein [Silurus meridionalis]
MRCVTVVLCCTVLLVQLMMTNSQNADNNTRCIPVTEDSGDCAVYNDTTSCPNDSSSGSEPEYSQASFDLSSFIGGIILVLSLQAGAFFALRFLKTKDSTYETIYHLLFLVFMQFPLSSNPGSPPLPVIPNMEGMKYLYKTFIPSVLSRFIHQLKLCVGFDTVTMFITPEKIGAFYMCHVCEEQLSTANIVSHLSSDHHYFKYLVIELPNMMLRKYKKLQYPQGLNLLLEYSCPKKEGFYGYLCILCKKQLSAPQCISHCISFDHVYSYLRNSAVSKPFYLCHACELNIPVSSVSIHLTSTQHYLNVFAYSKPDLVYLGSQNLDQCAKEEEQNQGKQKMVLQDMAHPGSLKREDSEQVSLIMDLGKQAEKIAPNTTLRKVDLSIWKFNEVDKSSFTSALSVLQALCKDEGLGELKPTVVPGARLVSSVKEINSSQCEEQERTPPDTNKINIEEACTDTPINKTNKQSNSEYPDLLHTNHKELSKTSFISSHHVRPDESSLATTHSDSSSTQPPISFLHEEQSELRKLDEKSVKQEGFPDQISTNDDPNVKMSHPQTQDSSVPQQQNVELAQKSVKEVEGLQKPTQSLACSEAETPAGL